MLLRDVLNVCSFPVWINCDGFSERYESREEVHENLSGYLVTYITVDGSGELTIEADRFYQ